MSFIAGDVRHLGGTSVGNGHCVALVREAAGAPHTSAWRRGAKVRGAKLPAGTAIATFDPGGGYGNHLDGRSHAALLEAEHTDGLYVWDQWLGRPVGPRLIRFKGGSGKPVDDGDCYFVLEAAGDAAKPGRA